MFLCLLYNFLNRWKDIQFFFYKNLIYNKTKHFLNIFFFVKWLIFCWLLFEWHISCYWSWKRGVVLCIGSIYYTCILTFFADDKKKTTTNSKTIKIRIKFLKHHEKTKRNNLIIKLKLQDKHMAHMYTGAKIRD